MTQLSTIKLSKFLFGTAVLTSLLTACGNDKAQSEPAQSTQAPAAAATGTVELLNVSYDVARDFYKEYNPLFINHYKTVDPNITLSVKQSHGGSSKQAQSINQGLQADVATMNQGSDIELLAKNNLVAATWEQDLPNNAVPFTSTVVFLVRKDNPKAIKDWTDLTKEGTKLVIANPKTTGNGRYAFLGAYGFGLKTFNGDKAKTDEFTKSVLANVEIFENGGRAATTTFAQRGIGDVLITFESEAHTIVNDKFKDQNLQIVYPSYTVSAENPVAVVQSVTDKKGTTAIAKAYLEYLWSEEGQELGAKMNLRPSVESVLAKHQDKFPKIETFRPNDVFGNWDTIMGDYFKDGGIYDNLAVSSTAKAN